MFCYLSTNITLLCKTYYQLLGTYDSSINSISRGKTKFAMNKPMAWFNTRYSFID
eukprot:GAHX01002056.1.p1 GENE.GAHX01002056.1~~GAHX01002056.1.p1  ORF type:complete len:55 (-),score=7.26 GAHX01002056.1:635-799(-)